MLEDFLECNERALIEIAMTLCEENQARAAEMLGINRSTLTMKLTRHRRKEEPDFMAVEKWAEQIMCKWKGYWTAQRNWATYQKGLALEILRDGKS